MRSTWIALVFALLFLVTGSLGNSPLFAQPASPSDLPEGFQFRTFNDETGSHQYALFLPRQYNPARKWPVLLFLHGAGEKGTDPRLLLTGQLAVALEKWPDLPFLAVFPQCEDRSGRALTGWLADSPDGQRAMNILADVERNFSTDPDRRLLAGWSMGGYGAWSLATAFPDKWSSVLILAGGAVHDQLPLKRLAEERTPVWAISAQGDPLIPFERSQTLVDQVNTLGGDATFTLLDSSSHDFCTRVFSAPQVFEWLLNPASHTPARIDLSAPGILPTHTRYYEQSILELKTIPRALALRLGNEPFEQLAPELPALLSSAPLTGTLADVEQTFGTGDNKMSVRLSDLRYRCDVTQIWAHGISGGRLGLEVGFHPLEMTIGQTVLDSREHQARTGPIRIRIGIHDPALLKLEVQPVIESGKLRLRLLRKEIVFDDGNWYITPPQVLEAHSDQFTPDQLVTGIVGSLYGARDELTNRILGVVPELLHRTERELELRSAPGLAQVLSPLPVLVPDVKVAPAVIRTDANGVSVLCDLKIGTRSQTAPLPAPLQLQLQEMPRDNRLSMDIALGAITSVSQLTVDQQVAQVNVLDISEDKFAALADPQIMKDVLPALEAQPAETLNTVLRLVAPMVVTGQSTDVSGDSAELLLTSSMVAIDVYRDAAPEQKPVPLGQILFSLAQPLRIHSPEDNESPDAAFELVWDPACEVNFLRADSLPGSSVPEVQGERFEEIFKAAWSSWGQAHGRQEIPMTVSRVGSSRLRLHHLHATEHLLNLQLDVQSDKPIAEKAASTRR